MKKNLAGIALACALIPALTLGGSAAFAVADPELPAALVSAELDATGGAEEGSALPEVASELSELNPGVASEDAQLETLSPEESPPATGSSVPGTEAPAPNAAEAPAHSREVSGVVVFPAAVPTDVRGKMQYSLFPTTGYDQKCLPPSTSGKLSFSNLTTGEFRLTELPACDYNLHLYYSVDAVERTVIAADMIRVDLRAGNQRGVSISAQVRGGATTSIQGKSENNQFPGKIYMQDARGAETDVSHHLGGWGGGGPEGWVQGYAFAVPGGTYTLRLQLENGTRLYYSASAKQGLTTSAAQATKFTITNFVNIRLKEMSINEWLKPAPKPKPTAPTFTDVKRGAPFYSDIRWLADSGITTGVKQANGSYKFLPKDSVTREAMIAFLYRANGVKNYTPKGASPFVDVKKGDQFYTQIMWAYENKVTTGINLGNGKRKFDPKATITREAMAAFMYRQYAKSIPVGSAPQNFTDIPANHKFAKEIKWMASNKITTGVKQSNGTVKFVPKGATSREATAAFLHRAELKK